VKRHRTSVGLDVHARSIVACALDGDTGEVFERRLTPDYRDVLEWLRSVPGRVVVTYEAGPTGFGLARFLIAAGMLCLVAAPSKLQRPAGDRVKTDARDGAHLARLLHLGQIVEVVIPSAEQEAARDLVRAREDCRGDLMSARHRVSKLLLRQGIVYSGGGTWTGKHQGWLAAQRFEATPLQLAYDTALDTMLATVDRRNRLDTAIAELGRRQCLHPGGDPAGVSAWGVHADCVRAGRRDRRLAPTDRPLNRRLPGLGAHRVLVGRFRSRGSITKTGNSHARRLLIEAAWHHRQPYRPGVDLRRRWDAASPAARARGQQANRRLYARWQRFDTRAKRPVVANTAIARELAGWCWSLAVLKT
jgi:transposase